MAAVCDGIEAVFAALEAGSDPFGIASGGPPMGGVVGRARAGPARLSGPRSASRSPATTSGTSPRRPRVSLDGNGLGLEHARFYDSSALYATPAVEIRSAAIAHALLVSKAGSCGRVPALARLVEHLVLQTVFHFEKVSDDAPFWFPMQVVDMIGSYFFLSVPRLEAIAGLFAEMRVQRPGSIPVLPFLTSLEERFEKLVADPGARKDVLAVFERNSFGRTARVGLRRPGPVPRA